MKELLKSTRSVLGMSLADVGVETGVSKQYVHDIEKGRRPASAAFVKAFKAMLRDKKKIIQDL